MTLLVAEHLRKEYGSTVAVDDISLSVSAGEIFGLLGPNGAGKSTTMMMVAGLLTPTRGSIELEGQSFSDGRRELRRLMGVVPQDLALYPELTARENLSFFAGLYGLKGPKLRERIDAMLELTGLVDPADRRVATYSGGMKRRLNMGIGLIHEPRLLILDEPTVGVDSQSRSHLLDWVRRLSDGGLGVIYASHYMEEVQAICDRVAVIDHGKMLACDTLAKLLERVQGQIAVRVSGAIKELKQSLGDEVEWIDGENDEAELILHHDGSQTPAGRLGQEMASLLAKIDSHQVQVTSIETREADLEQLFLQLTGSQLRD
jgi:ABC-2 type transport system ATP-binding protein